jgi:predicted SAM-dependent methyltransferase
MSRVHIGCGTVYLDGWVNLDLPGPTTYLASNRPDLVERWRTTEDKYFAKHSNASVETLRKPTAYQEYVCDRYANFDNLPFAAWSVSEILARHAFEHLSITEAHRALDQMDEVLKEGGLLRLDVPDHEGTLQEFKKTGDEFYIRHLLGPRRNDHGFHMMSYTRDRLRRLVEEHGFVFVKEEPNIHFYPAFCLRFIKPGLRPPCEYVELPPLPDHVQMLDVGPGPFPHPRATHYLDLNPEHLKPMSDKGKSTILADLSTGLPRIESKRFDYVWCSHVLEHVDDPRKAASTLSRIAKRGTLVLPSVIKESLFNFEEADHQWLILPAPNAEGPVFVRHNCEYMKAVKNIDVQRITCRLFRSGPNRIDPEQRLLRSWYFRNEVHLDVIHHWEGELRVQVIG